MDIGHLFLRRHQLHYLFPNIQYILFSPQFIFHKPRDGPNPVEFPSPKAIDKRPIKGRKKGRKSGQDVRRRKKRRGRACGTA
jgi:hypothetical protein